MREDIPVKVSVLELLAREPKRYSEIVRDLNRPDKTVYVTLNALTDQKLVAKNDEDGGRYELTDEGRQELERIKFVRIAGEEDDLRIIQNTRAAIALGRCYDILSELRYISARTLRKLTAEDRGKIREEELVIRNLLLKYNPSLSKVDLVKAEEEEVKVGLQELLSGGFWWGKRLVKFGLTERYTHLVNLTIELPAGPVKDQIVAALELIRDASGKMDERLKSLAPIREA